MAEAGPKPMTENQNSSLESYHRPLRPSEKRLLRVKARGFEQAGGRQRYVLVAAGGVFAVLWASTLLVAEAPWTLVTFFWVVIGAGITLWVKRDLTRDQREDRAMLRRIESARRRDTAQVFDVRSRAFAEFEEVEDEGSCFAFQLDSDRMAFISGQQFYPSARFPSLDFSLVYILDEEDRIVDEMIEKRGPRTDPSRVVPSKLKWKMEIPEHLEVRRGSLETLDASLRPDDSN
jgi:hypothetical protein